MDSYDPDTIIDHLFSSEHTAKDAVARVHNWISAQAYDHPEASLRDSVVLSPACESYLSFSPSCPDLSSVPSLSRRKEPQAEWEQETPDFWVERATQKSRRPNLSRDKPLPVPPPFDPDLADPFFPSSPAPTVSSFASASSTTTPPLSRASSQKSLHGPRLSRSMSSSRFPSISSTLSSNPVDETPPQSPGLYAFPSGRSSMSKSDLPKLPPTLPLRLPLRRNHSSHPNDSTATLTGTPSSPTNSHLFPSYAGLPNPSLSTITTPALTDNGSPSSSTSSRAPRTVPSALSLFHLPSRTNLKSSSPPSPISPAEEPTQHRYFNYYTASPTSSGGPSPATVLSPLSAASESRWSFATSEPDLTLASAPVSPTSNAFPGVESAKRIRNKSFHFPSLSLPSALGGEKKKKLVINGVEPGDARAMEAVRRWCESHGEVSRFQWKPDGLHVHFRKASVADTVCRLQAQVEIKGAGSVSLSWYQGKRRP